MQREQGVVLDFLRIRPSEPMLFIDKAEIARCVTYRQAVRLAWDMRQPRGMTMRTLAELCGMYPQHVSSYLHEDPLLPSSFAKPSPSAFSIELMGWSLRTLSDIRDSLVGWALSFAQRCGRDVRS
ncbi:hypothetical protein [Bordetella bronchiseptica]|uniref:hypothetical protein n=1 Tax=Bordetella bronchiseptica TaxID=518 RepID=UPI0009B88358|nr:hypothetical protein [Bordetella bronchiseptica]AWP75715.1 hypothetical protein B7P10_15130 [Bordetella bronchiseptica]